MAIGKNRYWEGILYPENMVDDWQEVATRRVQLPLAICLHDKDKDQAGEHRKDHFHAIIAFPGPTTYKHAKEVFNTFSAPGHICISTVEPIYSIRSAYDYLIHDTDACRKANKHLYPSDARQLFNGFDIGSFEQISEADKNRMFDDLVSFALNNQIGNFSVFVEAALVAYADQHDLLRLCLRSYGAFFHRLTVGIFHKEEYYNAKDKTEIRRESDSARVCSNRE